MSKKGYNPTSNYIASYLTNRVAYCAEIDSQIFQLAVKRFEEYDRKLNLQPRLLEEIISYGATNDSAAYSITN